MGQGRGGGGDLERAAAEDKTPAEREEGGDGRDVGGAGGEPARRKTAGDSRRTEEMASANPSRAGFRLLVHKQNYGCFFLGAVEAGAAPKGLFLGRLHAEMAQKPQLLFQGLELLAARAISRFKRVE